MSANSQTTFPFRRSLRNLALVVALAAAAQLHAAPGLPMVKGVEAQPFAAQVKRLVEAMEYSGAPFDQKTRKALDAALAQAEPERSSEAIQQILDPHCLFAVQINPE